MFLVKLNLYLTANIYLIIVLSFNLAVENFVPDSPAYLDRHTKTYIQNNHLRSKQSIKKMCSDEVLELHKMAHVVHTNSLASRV